MPDREAEQLRALVTRTLGVVDDLLEATTNQVTTDLPLELAAKARALRDLVHPELTEDEERPRQPAGAPSDGRPLTPPHG